MATILNIIVGYDKRDSTSIKKEKIDYTKALTKDIRDENRFIKGSCGRK